MWQDLARFGGENDKARTDEELVGMIETKGSKLEFHKAIVPPLAFWCSRASSGWWRSSELRWYENCPWSVLKRALASHWNSCGSDRKTKSGLWKSVKCLREWILRWIPSIFHEKHVKLEQGASDLDLSGASSLKTQLLKRWIYKQGLYIKLMN